MANVYFHYSHARGVLIDRSGADVDDLIDAHEQAQSIVRSLLMIPSFEDWRDWVLHVTNNQGDEIFDLPFATMLGKPH